MRDGKFEFSVESTAAGPSVIGDNPYLQKTAQGKWCVVTRRRKTRGDSRLNAQAGITGRAGLPELAGASFAEFS